MSSMFLCRDACEKNTEGGGLLSLELVGEQPDEDPKEAWKLDFLMEFFNEETRENMDIEGAKEEIEVNDSSSLVSPCLFSRTVKKELSEVDQGKENQTPEMNSEEIDNSLTPSLSFSKHKKSGPSRCVSDRSDSTVTFIPSDVSRKDELDDFFSGAASKHDENENNSKSMHSATPLGAVITHFKTPSTVRTAIITPSSTHGNTTATKKGLGSCSSRFATIKEDEGETNGDSEPIAKRLFGQPREADKGDGVKENIEVAKMTVEIARSQLENDQIPYKNGNDFICPLSEENVLSLGAIPQRTSGLSKDEGMNGSHGVEVASNLTMEQSQENRVLSPATSQATVCGDVKVAVKRSWGAYSEDAKNAANFEEGEIGNVDNVDDNVRACGVLQECAKDTRQATSNLTEDAVDNLESPQATSSKKAKVLLDHPNNTKISLGNDQSVILCANAPSSLSVSDIDHKMCCESPTETAPTVKNVSPVSHGAKVEEVGEVYDVKSSMLAGFQTASKKKVVVDPKRLEAAKRSLEEVDRAADLIPLGPPVFEGFQTASKKKVEMDPKKLEAAKQSFVDADKTSDLQPTDIPAFQGFQTASKKKVEIDPKHLEAAKRSFAEADKAADFQQADVPVFQGFQTASKKKVEIDPKHLEAAKRSFAEADKTSHLQPADIPAFQGFQTASKKKVEIDPKHLEAAKQSFAEADKTSDLQPADIPAFQGFQTASKKKVEIEPKKLEAAKRSFAEADKTSDLQPANGPVFQEFQTASKRNVEIGPQGLKVAKRAFADADITGAMMSSGTPVSDGFTIGPNKHASVSAKALAPTNKKVPSDTDSNCANNLNLTALGSFKTASDRKILVDAENLTKAQESFKVDCTGKDALDIIRPSIFDKPMFDRNMSDNRTPKKYGSGTLSVGHTPLTRTMGRVGFVTPKPLLHMKPAAGDSSLKPDSLPTKHNSCKPLSVNSRRSKMNFEESPSLLSSAKMKSRLSSGLYRGTASMMGRQSGQLRTPARGAIKGNSKFKTPSSTGPVVSLSRKSLSATPTAVKPYTRVFEMSSSESKCGLQSKVSNCSHSLQEILPRNSVCKIDDLLTFSFQIKDLHSYVEDFCLKKNTFSIPFSNESETVGVSEIAQGLWKCPGVKKTLCPMAWVENHFRNIIWKLLSYKCKFNPPPKHVDPFEILNQLRYRYEKEINMAQRSALKLIVEKDASPSQPMVLCVSKIYLAKGDEKIRKVQLTDGWYFIDACMDEHLTRLILSGDIFEGLKLFIFSTSVSGQNAASPLEEHGSEMLLSFNAVRRARWYVKLGFRKIKPYSLPLSSSRFQGGIVPWSKIIVCAVYDMHYKTRKGGNYQLLSMAQRERVLNDKAKLLESQVAANRAQVKGFKSKPFRKKIEQCLTGEDVCLFLEHSRDPERSYAALTSEQKNMYEEEMINRKCAQNDHNAFEKGEKDESPMEPVFKVKVKDAYSNKPDFSEYFLIFSGPCAVAASECLRAGMAYFISSLSPAMKNFRRRRCFYSSKKTVCHKSSSSIQHATLISDEQKPLTEWDSLFVCEPQSESEHTLFAQILKPETLDDTGRINTKCLFVGDSCGHIAVIRLTMPLGFYFASKDVKLYSAFLIRNLVYDTFDKSVLMPVFRADELTTFAQRVTKPEFSKGFALFGNMCKNMDCQIAENAQMRIKSALIGEKSDSLFKILENHNFVGHISPFCYAQTVSLYSGTNSSVVRCSGQPGEKALGNRMVFSTSNLKELYRFFGFEEDMFLLPLDNGVQLLNIVLSKSMFLELICWKDHESEVNGNECCVLSGKLKKIFCHLEAECSCQGGSILEAEFLRIQKRKWDLLKTLPHNLLVYKLFAMPIVLELPNKDIENISLEHDLYKKLVENCTVHQGTLPTDKESIFEENFEMLVTREEYQYIVSLISSYLCRERLQIACNKKMILCREEVYLCSLVRPVDNSTRTKELIKELQDTNVVNINRDEGAGKK